MMHPAFATLPAWADPWPGRGIIYNLPEDQYHETKALVSKSALDTFDRSPLHYHYSLTAPPEPPTDAMKIGSAFHVLTLEPDLFDRKIVVQPDFGPMQSSTNRKIRDAWAADEARGRLILSQAQYDTIVPMAAAVRAHPAASLLLRRGEPEVTALWTDPETGIRCKSRADWLSAIDGVFVDLKSALSAEPRAFARAAADNRYHVQDAFYSRAFEENDVHIEHFVFIAVEKAPPYAVSCMQIDETGKAAGELLYTEQLRALRACIDADRWPGYGDHVIDLRLPAWATSNVPV